MHYNAYWHRVSIWSLGITESQTPALLQVRVLRLWGVAARSS